MAIPRKLTYSGSSGVPLLSFRVTLAAAVAAILLCVPATAGAATYPAGFEERTIVSGLNLPTGIAWAPDGRMFVIEKGGLLKVVPAGGIDGDHGPRTSATEVNSYSDRGLLGIAVDSSFASNGTSTCSTPTSCSR